MTQKRTNVREVTISERSEDTTENIKRKTVQTNNSGFRSLNSYDQKKEIEIHPSTLHNILIKVPGI